MWLTLTFTPLKEKKATKALKSGEERRNGNQRVSKLIWPSRDIYTEIRWVFKSSVVYGSRQKQICNPATKVHFFLSNFWKKSNKCFEKVEKGGEMTQLTLQNTNITRHLIQKYVEFSNPVYIYIVYTTLLLNGSH